MKFFASIIFCCFITVHVIAQKPMPRYEEVITQYFKTYEPQGKDGGYDVLFEKREAGWYTVVRQLNSALTDRELFWSKTTGKYQHLTYNLHKGKEVDEDAKKGMLQGTIPYSYNTMPYFGYVGCYGEVIKLLESTPQLSDTLLCALARAYSFYAADLLNSNSGYAEPEKQYQLKDGTVPMSVSQIAEYRRLVHRSTELFEQLEKRNPNFQLYVGSIKTRVGNAYMIPYLELLTYSNEEEAKKELKSGLYSDFILDCSKNLLNTCAPNAILFVQGDNDTYPLLYVQAQYGFRKDVRVVNTSLLNTAAYINTLRIKHLDSRPIAMTIPYSVYADKRCESILVTDQWPDEMQLGSMVDYIMNPTFYKGTNNHEFKELGTKGLGLVCANGDKMYWSLATTSIYKNELALLDMLATSKMDRPFYMSGTLNHSFYDFTKQYLIQEGAAYRLTTKDTTGDKIRIDTKLVYENIMNSYLWGGVRDIDEEKRRMCLNPKFSFCETAKALIAQGDTAKAIELLKKSGKLFPNSLIPNNLFDIATAQAWYYANKKEEGARIFNQILDNYQNPPLAFIEDGTIEPDMGLMEIATYIKQLATQYDEPELVARCEKIIAKAPKQKRKGGN